ncbi:MAG: ribose 5-phosphate isomerase B [Actinomycetota bacterium]|nr:ribose 5-phosphate isomerase B [Actinomycetota bacterium]
MNIVITSDHAGFNYKSSLIKILKSMGHNIIDAGTDSNESVDYPDFAEKASNYITSGEADIGVFICGSGIGMSIAANKIKGIRAAVCWSTESAKVARDHNCANVLCMGERFLLLNECIQIARVFINTPPGTEERHLRRVNKITKIEERNFICND